MKVILRDDIESLGKMGDIVTVADGYARNFLFPKKLAVQADTKNMRAVEHERRVIQDRSKKLHAAAATIAERLATTKVTIRAKAGEEDKLFGSVTSMDIASKLKELGIEIDRKKIVIADPIKRLGSYSVEVKLGHEVTASLPVEVVAEQ